MADVLEYLTRRPEVKRVYDMWTSPLAHVYSDTLLLPDRAADIATRYTLELRSRTQYIIPATDVDSDLHPAHRYARKSLVRHLYGKQLDIVRRTRHALYNGASRNEVQSLLSELEESMSE